MTAKFIFASIFSYLMIVAYLSLLYIPSFGWLLDLGIKPSEIPGLFMLIGYIIVPPIIGALSFIMLSNKLNVDLQKSYVLIPVYLAIYQLSMYMSGVICTYIFKFESISTDNIYSVMCYSVIQMLLIMGTLYIIHYNRIFNQN